MDNADDFQLFVESSRQPREKHSHASSVQVTAEASLKNLIRTRTEQPQAKAVRSSAPAERQAAAGVLVEEHIREYLSRPKEPSKKPAIVIVHDFRPGNVLAHDVQSSLTGYWNDPAWRFYDVYSDKNAAATPDQQARRLQPALISTAVYAATGIAKHGKAVLASAGSTPRLHKAFMAALKAAGRASSQQSPRERLKFTEWDKGSIVFRTLERRRSIRAGWRPS